MNIAIAWVLTMSLGAGPEIEPEHAKNPIYEALLQAPVDLNGPVRVPPPILHDGQAAPAQAAALLKLAGSPERRDDLFLKGPNAPIILENPDQPGKSRSIIRTQHLAFIVHATLDKIDWTKLDQDKAGNSEAGGIRVATEEAPDKTLQARGITLSKSKDLFPKDWFNHSVMTMFDRLQVETTDRLHATRSAGSVVIASRTDARFAADGPGRNFWRPFKTGDGGERKYGAMQPYPGGVGYVKISDYKPVPGTLFIEAYVFLSEPEDWFDGGPLLRSRMGTATNDQVKKFRRELAAKQAQ